MFAMVASMFGFITAPAANAAALTSVKDTLSTVKASTVANHTIQFVTPTGVAAAGTITVVFPTGFTMNAVDFADTDLAEGDSGTCSTATFTDKTLAAAASGATWGAALSSQTITFTSGTGTITLGRCVQIEVGTNATAGVAGDTQVTNSTAGNDKKMDITAGASDSGSLAISIIADDVVAVTASVNPALTFTITDNAIGFGALTASAATWANGAATGSATDTSAHNLTIATNAATGYAITYSGATLTSGSNTINVASVTNDADGAPSSEQFGLGLSTDGNAAIATGYDHNATAGNRDWAFVAGTTTTVVSETVPTATETISAYYLANIATTTEPGSYSTNITYIATGIF